MILEIRLPRPREASESEREPILNIVMLTSDGLEHQYVTHALLDAFGDQISAIITAEPPPKPFRDRLRRLLRRYSVTELASRAAIAAYRRLTHAQRRREQTLARILFPNGPPNARRIEERRHVVPYHNGAKCRRMLAELEPDIIAVYGTTVIGPAVIALARHSIVNMHTGISPRYRGADTTFWPIYNDEPEWIGVTVHVLDEGIDTGAILRIGRPDLDATDDFDSVFAKTVKTGAPLYVDALRAILDDSIEPLPQDLSEGRSYRAVERGIRAETVARRKLARGVLARAGAEPR